jgi:small multidrug resistance family-3 protein
MLIGSSINPAAWKSPSWPSAAVDRHRFTQLFFDTTRMIKIVQNIHPLVFLLIATTLEVSGDALVRIGIYNHVGLARIAPMVAGAALLFGYGSTINLAPLEFRQVVGLYIATLFVVWQVINFIAFRTFPNLPIVVGGALIIAGGLIVTFWKPGCSN